MLEPVKNYLKSEDEVVKVVSAPVLDIKNLNHILNVIKIKLEKIFTESAPVVLNDYESVLYKIDRVVETVSNYNEWEKSSKALAVPVSKEEYYEINQKVRTLHGLVTSYRKDFERIEDLYKGDGESEYYLKKDGLMEEFELMSSKRFSNKYHTEADRKVIPEKMSNAYKEIHILLFESFFTKLSDANILINVVSSFVVEDRYDSEEKIIRPIMMKPRSLMVNSKVKDENKEKYDVFNSANLTEDYELGLRFYKLGFKTSFVNYRTGSDFGNSMIATGEYFPNTFRGSVKQKSRWIAGIVFQNWKIHGWVGSLKTKYFLLRDRKTIFSFFGTALSYILFIYLIGYTFVSATSVSPLSAIIVKGSVLWYLMLVCLFFMFVNISHRFIFTYNWFGLRYALSGIYRIFFDTVVNVFASVRAVKVFRQTKHKVVWDSTEHY